MPRVLIVDDDPAIRAWLTAQLTPDYDVEEAVQAAGVARTLALGGVDLALIDYHLPDATGLDLLSELRAAGRTTPVVIITADASQQVAVQCFRAGAQDFIAKPMDPDFLKIIVARTLAHHARTLKNSALRALGYTQHKPRCVFHRDGQHCDCGLKEVYEDIQDF